MKDKCILIIPIIEENPNVFSKLLKTLNSVEFCEILFAVSPKNKFKETYKNLEKIDENSFVIFTDKNYNKNKLYQEALSYFNLKIKNESTNYKYVMSIKKFDNDYINLIIDGLLEIEKTSLDVVYCLSNNNKKSLKTKVKKTIKKSIVDTFKSPLFIASYKFVNTVYSNPFNKVATFYHLIKNAKPKPNYY